MLGDRSLSCKVLEEVSPLGDELLFYGFIPMGFENEKQLQQYTSISYSTSQRPAMSFNF